MQTISKHWSVTPQIPDEVTQALEGIHLPIVRQVMYSRGYTTYDTARHFLEAKSPEGCEPENLLGMQVAVLRVVRAIRDQELIAVYGDYDVDGVTATSVLVQILKELGGRVKEFIPKRDDGYGVNNEAIASLKEYGIQLIITVDCGIRSPVEAALACQLGMDMIITDHHEPSDVLPKAVAIINPKQPGDTYVNKDLAGVGLAYKLADALVRYLRRSGDPKAESTHPESYLDLVALGTVADLAPLTGENRSLVRDGLKLIRENPRPGIRSLIGVAGLHPERIDAGHIGFMLGPRLNAAGRLDTAMDAFTLLTTEEIGKAGLLAQHLDNQNRERQKLTKEIQELAEQKALKAGKEPLLLFAVDPDFIPGVIGLAASRLAEMYYRPAIVAQRGETYTRGSCRSISEFHITAALDQCADLLEHHGGHAAAAGFTVRNELLDQLVERLQGIAVRELANMDLRPTLHADGEVRFADIHRDNCPQLLSHLDWLQPTGYGNGPAVFVTRNVRVNRATPVGKDSSHLKLWVSDGEKSFDAIAFRQGHKYDPDLQAIDLMYTIERNDYNGQNSWQLVVRDMKPAGTPD
jgi:single-stranded-DNA-specific exonuclease